MGRLRFGLALIRQKELNLLIFLLVMVLFFLLVMVLFVPIAQKSNPSVGYAMQNDATVLSGRW